MRHTVPGIILTIIFLSVLSSFNAFGKAPLIENMPNELISPGTVYRRIPSLTEVSGTDVRWTKEYGPDDLTVNILTGEVSWNIPSRMSGEAFYIGVRASNRVGHDMKIWILKVGDGKFVYVDPNAKGDDSGRNWENACLTIQRGGLLTDSGDVLVIKNGEYREEANRLYNDPGGRGTLPASGTSEKWTTILAETPGGVVLDGENQRQPFRIKGNWDGNRGASGAGSHDVSYLAIKGIIACRSGVGGPISLNAVQNVKLVLCGGYDQAPDSSAVIGIGKSNYVLVESCFAWGHGREMIAAFLSDHIVFRRCVVRMDRSTSSEPLGGYVHYAGRDSLTANCIMIDSDQPQYWKNHTYLAGAFCNDCGGYCYYDYAQIQNVVTTHCLALNCYGKILVASNTHFTDIAEPPQYRNTVAWDISAWYGNGAHLGNPTSIVLSRGDIIIDQCTFGELSSPAGLIENGVFFNSWQDNTDSVAGDIITDSIIYNVKDYGGTGGGVFHGWNTVDYCLIYDTGAINVSDTTPTNMIYEDITDKHLKYITEIGYNTSLDSAGKNGKRVGAILNRMVGKSGTIWGENGFDSETSTPMWPFPHEELIREKMSEYSFDNGLLSGKRGFCADGQTLTNYVWSYLGKPAPPFNLVAISGDNEVALSWNPNATVEYVGDIEIGFYKVYVGDVSGKYNHVEYINGKDVGNQTDVVISNLENEKPYYFAVSAVYGGDESRYSDEISATPHQAFKSFISSPLSGKIVIGTGSSIRFEGTAVGGTEPYGYVWDFDGATDTYTISNPGDITFATPGEYQISFTVTDSDGNHETLYIVVMVVADDNKTETNDNGGGGSGCFIMNLIR